MAPARIAKMTGGAVRLAYKREQPRKIAKGLRIWTAMYQLNENRRKFSFDSALPDLSLYALKKFIIFLSVFLGFLLSP